MPLNIHRGVREPYERAPLIVINVDMQNDREHNKNATIAPGPAPRVSSLVELVLIAHAMVRLAELVYISEHHVIHILRLVNIL